MEISAYRTGRTRSSDKKVDIPDAKKVILTQMRIILSENSVSDGKEGTYHAKNASLAQMTATMAQATPPGTERRTPLINGRANDPKDGTTSQKIFRR